MDRCHCWWVGSDVQLRYTLKFCNHGGRTLIPGTSLAECTFIARISRRTGKSGGCLFAIDEIASSNHDYAAIIIAEDKLEGLRCATTLVMTCR